MSDIISLDESRFGQWRKLLQVAGLPVSDFDGIDWLVSGGIYSEGQLVAAAGLERCGDECLLRSLVTDPQHRRKGHGVNLVSFLHQAAIETDHGQVYLMTLDQQDFFSSKFDYVALNRSDVPHDIKQSSQFTGVCPDTAIVMNRLL